ncbi:hypothetical protein N7E81_13955 [Reichenbachiella carrageenanivorans]|uniref:Lipocalin-like domain-containing protein n=1 Tax=Reichenbachiella carrageenanivorans TaxID=2979869 RepID=A0ABY6CX09_9BACT|nr:hypothetical protein [Reichenbachiella carrageenanivorans]UXX78461.1 hypothetical protein N7E81_13955 [Reichenbachiella carrageenanivorans]
MRIIWVVQGLLATMILTSACLLIQLESPEELLVGEWEELSWEYEKVNHQGNSNYSAIDEAQKREIIQNLILHESEIWQFEPNKRLTFISANGRKESLSWHVKGRGNILELRHDDERIEEYQVQQLSEDLLVIHFNFDLQVKGIVKMTFKRMNNKNA